MERMIEDTVLIERAQEAREKSYCPYSGYAVGAALLTEDGRIFTGCNVENASYGAANCAERTAVFKAVSEGAVRFTKIAVVGGKKGSMVDDYAFPCGICRQVLREFSDPAQFEIITARSQEQYKKYTLEQMLPDSFGPEMLQEEGAAG